MNIVLAHDLYPQSLEGDEPEPLPQVRWPIANMMALLAEPDFREARNVSALFLSGGVFACFALIRFAPNKKGQISLALFDQNSSWLSPPGSVNVVPVSRDG